MKSIGEQIILQHPEEMIRPFTPSEVLEGVIIVDTRVPGVLQIFEVAYTAAYGVGAVTGSVVTTRKSLDTILPPLGYSLYSLDYCRFPTMNEFNFYEDNCKL